VVRAPSGQGLNPYVSLWDDGPNPTWPPEIALFECPAEPRTEAVFSNRFGAPDAPQAEELRTGVDCAAGLHTYTVEWTPDALRWFVDGVERGVITENVPATPMAIVLALTAPACDDPVTGCPGEDVALPAFMEVDRVRVWRLSDDAPPPTSEPAPETAPSDAAPSDTAEAAPPPPEEPESSTPLSAFTASGPSGLIILGLGGLSLIGGLGLLVWALRLRSR
jgi:beta-glucanase (GH16 family)